MFLTEQDNLNKELFYHTLKQRSNIVHFLEGIRYILLSNIIDIVLGDFNINYLNDDDVKGLKTLMDSLDYTQVVDSATFIDLFLLEVF